MIALKYAETLGVPIPLAEVREHRVDLLILGYFPFHMKEIKIACSLFVIAIRGQADAWILYRSCAVFCSLVTRCERLRKNR